MKKCILKPFRKVAIWWFWNENLPCPQWFAPHLLGFGLGRKGIRIVPKGRDK